MYIMYIPSTNFEKKEKKLVFLLFRRPNLVFAIFSSHPDWPVTLLSNFSNVIFKYIFLKSLSL